jgi:hypothetical protein
MLAIFGITNIFIFVCYLKVTSSICQILFFNILFVFLEMCYVFMPSYKEALHNICCGLVVH